LAKIYPDPSRFAVRVNSVGRTVSSISITGSKVLLYISSPIKSGDVVTVGYTKPLTNLLQCTAGSEAPNMTAMAAINNVGTTLSGPTYLSAVISSPTTVEMTYNTELSQVVPPPSSFNVVVDSEPVNVSTVEVSGNNVLLTLELPVSSVNEVILDYIVPSENPLQSISSGQAAGLIDILVKNILPIAIPEYVSSVIEDINPNMIEIYYTANLANLIPQSSAFIAKVNGISRPVSEIMINGNTVILMLQGNIKHGDFVTISYVKPAVNPLQALSGGIVFTFADKTVINKIVKEPEITIYPNPATDFISISNLEPTTESRSIRIYDYSGKLCLEAQLNPDNINRIPINLKSGVYIVQIVSGQLIKNVQKLIIQ
jgi:uncharacterized repeat protein (TIGR02059 family)